MIDAVSSAGFITPKKTKILIEKLEGLISLNQAKALKSQVYCEGNNKCDNEEVYYVIDRLDEAINKRKQVKFTYRRIKHQMTFCNRLLLILSAAVHQVFQFS